MLRTETDWRGTVLACESQQAGCQAGPKLNLGKTWTRTRSGRVSNPGSGEDWSLSTSRVNASVQLGSFFKLWMGVGWGAEPYYWETISKCSVVPKYFRMHILNVRMLKIFTLLIKCPLCLKKKYDSSIPPTETGDLTRGGEGKGYE